VRHRLAPLLAVILACCAIEAGAEPKDYYPKRAWGGFNGGELNTSAFVFRDINRNGLYDLGDRPMPHVAVELRRPDGKTIVARTNIDGFANYKMSVVKRDRPVTDPGRYSFHVVAPPGWSPTTGNAVQESAYRILPGAPGDLVAETPTRPVGLAADLTISGTAAPGARLEATGPDGATVGVTAGDDGSFRFAAGPGAWRIAPQGGGADQERRVLVGHAPVVLSAFADASAPLPAALPDEKVIGFDDLIATPAVQEIPSGHGGLNWYNFIAMHQRFAGGPGYINTTNSGEFIAYNSSGHPAEVSLATGFDFVGGYFGAGWDGAEGETLILEAWRGDTKAYEDRIELSAMGPVQLIADYRGITRLRVSAAHYWQIAIDDFTYRTGR